MSDVLVISGGFAGVWSAMAAARVRREHHAEMTISVLTPGAARQVRRSQRRRRPARPSGAALPPDALRDLPRPWPGRGNLQHRLRPRRTADRPGGQRAQAIDQRTPDLPAGRRSRHNPVGRRSRPNLGGRSLNHCATMAGAFLLNAG